MMSSQITSYIIEQENLYETQEIQVGDNWFWNMRKHVQLIFHLKHGMFFSGANNWLRAFKNIMQPILNVAYWSEDIEVKDVLFFIEDKGSRALSFLIKKYHDEVFVRKYNLDTFFDEITESDIDYGGVLVQRTNTARPEVLPLQLIAFCDQKDILGAPIGFKHIFSPEKLRGMSKFGWGSEKNGATISIEDLIVLADEHTSPAGMNEKVNVSTGKQIEIYIVRGNLPEHYLKDNDDMEYYCNQLQIVAMYTDSESNRQGVVLYRKKAEEGDLMFHTSQKVAGRGLGRGEGEALLHPQIWTNFLEIHKMNMLESASKVPLYTDDSTYTQKNKIQDMENLEITTIEDGKKIYQVPTAAPVNVQLMDKALNEWYEHGQLSGSAFDPMMGKQSVSGTTFRGQNQIVQQGSGFHERRRGQRAKFIEEIYRKMILGDMKKEMMKGKKFMASLTTEEMQYVVDQLVINQTNEMKINYILDNGGDAPPPDVVSVFEDMVRQEFLKKGNKHLFEILENELQGIEIKMGINIAGKQKDVAGMSDKMFSIFKEVFANPAGFIQTMKIPGMSKTFQDILELGGLSPVDFSELVMMPNAPVPIEQQETEAPLQIA